MPVSSTVSDDGKAITISISISGRFDFAVQNEFRDSYYSTGPDDGVRFVIDMANASYMDSSALGMLLMMREHLGGNNASITLSNCMAEIRNILTVANFQSLFKVD